MGRFPLAVDLADTVRVVGGTHIELLDGDRALDRWIAAEVDRFPQVEAAFGRLTDTLELRDAVRELLAAHSSRQPLPDGPREMMNATSARSASFPTMTAAGDICTMELADDRYDVFAAEVARSAMAILTEGTTDLAVCRAPSCGMFFVRMNPRQRWCSPACGNRARVARHAARGGRHRP